MLVKLIPELKARGHEAIAIDMPGNGGDRTAPYGVVVVPGMMPEHVTSAKARRVS